MRHCVEHGDRCDALTLGMLLRGLKRQGLSPLPVPPYHGISFEGLGLVIKDMRLTTFCFELRQVRQDRTPHSYATLQCGIRGRIEDSVSAARSKLSGLIVPFSADENSKK